MTRRQITGVKGLTPAQVAVLTAIASGHNRRSAAEHLNYAESTVAAYLTRIRQRLDARTTAHAVALAVSAGVVRVEDVAVDERGRPVETLTAAGGVL